MRDSIVARNYAEALFELGERGGREADFAAAMEEVSALLAGSPRIRTFLESPKIDLAQKKDVLRRTLAQRVPPLFLNFLLVVLEKRRQRLLGEIAREYTALLDRKHDRVRAQVTLAHEPDERAEQEIAGELSRMLGRTVVPSLRVDPSILGGIVVRYGDRVLDGSLRRRLQTLRRRMLDTDLAGAAPARP